ncbi:hypothetical protein IQ272_31915 [Chroococcidiopsidales cyanobacterium LEGE 13417]|nr:hypothetical protein [Chroococcidiopsidales cyanobacterium LEGE 13417]
MLQNFLTIAIEVTIVAFAIVMAIDFVAGAVKLFESILRQSTAPTIQQKLVQSPSQKIAIAPGASLQLNAEPIEDPWLADSAAIATTAASAVIPSPQILLLPGARQPIPVLLDLTALKLYKLHNYSVVKVADIPIEIPAQIKRYKLHKRDVVRLIDLEKLLAT